MKRILFFFTLTITSVFLNAQQPLNLPSGSTTGTTNNGWIGLYSTTPKALFDNAGNISNATLGTVFGRLPEGNNTGAGTYLGVRGFGTQNTDYNGKGFSIEHGFYGAVNSTINFYRGGSTSGGFLTFNTNNDTERMRITASGNVGIGTLSPISVLDVQGQVGVSTLRLQGGLPYGTYYFDVTPFGNSTDGVGYAFNTKSGGGVYSNVLNFFKDKIGIGTTAPEAKLHIITNSTGSHDNSVKIAAPNIGANYSHIHWGTTGDWYVRSANSAGKVVLQDSGGKVAIGTSDTPGTHRLYVDGSILSTEVNVKTKASWPDYVFEPSYNLPTLSELEQYIKTNKHLPEVPSASEVKENGLSLGEMNAILLKKVEELTLHLIHKEKQIEELTSRVSKLENNK